MSKFKGIIRDRALMPSYACRVGHKEGMVAAAVHSNQAESSLVLLCSRTVWDGLGMLV